MSEYDAETTVRELRLARAEIGRLRQELTEAMHYGAELAQERDEALRLREYRDHHEFAVQQLGTLLEVELQTIGDVVKHVQQLQAEIERLRKIIDQSIAEIERFRNIINDRNEAIHALQDAIESLKRDRQRLSNEIVLCERELQSERDYSAGLRCELEWMD